MRNVTILSAIVLIVLTTTFVWQSNKVNERLDKLEAFQTKVDSTYMPNINTAFVNARYIDYWHERSLLRIDSVATMIERNNTLKVIEQDRLRAQTPKE